MNHPKGKPWSRTTRYVSFALVVAAIIWFLWVIRGMIGPLVIACLLAYVLNPIIAYVNSWSKLPRKWVVTLVYILIIGTLTVLAITFAPVTVEQTQGLTDELQIVQEQLIVTLNQQAQNIGIDVTFDEMFGDLENLLSSSLSPDQVMRVLQASSQNLAWILIILVTTFYLLQDWHRLREWIIDKAPGDYRADVRRLYGEIKDTWQAYLWGQLTLMLIIGILSGIGAAAVGLQGSAVVLGLLAGVLDVIPSAGPAVAMAIATAVAWFQGPPDYLQLSNLWFMLLVLSIFAAIQTIENIWLRPRIMGHSLRLHPGVVFVAVMGSLALGGILIALLIIPVIGTLGIIGSYLRARIFGLEPWPEDAQLEQANNLLQAESENSAVEHSVEVAAQVHPQPEEMTH
ncbi:MAG: AI-2E family transporter [Anaerolineales bacterium]|nr:AI-2E family transporter [Anaerolineales bacterium]